MPNPDGNIENLKPYQSQWKSGPTKVIRVPVVIADELLEIAKTLDETGGSSGLKPDILADRKRLDSTASVQDSTNIEGTLKAILGDPMVTRGGRDRASCRRALNAFVMRLKQ